MTGAALLLLLALGGAAASPGATAESLAPIKEMFFADDLDGMVGKAKVTPKDVPPWTHLKKAMERKKAGDLKGARAALHLVLEPAPGESRMEALVWSGLRRLGEQPPQDVADKVLGVVMEVPLNGGVDTLAAYADGRARYINHAGGLVVWETIDDPKSQIVRDVTDAAQAAVASVPAVPRRAPYGGKLVRITLLTPGGLRVQEGSFDAIGAGALGPAFNAGALTLQMLVDQTVAQKNAQKKAGN